MNAKFTEFHRVLAVIMGGGAGTRLFPLTKERAKPAVPLAGKYRLVDIPISLCINSGLKRIFLLTQYLSSSLHRHVQQSYRFDDYEPRGFIEILAATQTRDKFSWYQGTADAVRQNLGHLNNHPHDLVLILSGDQLYRMDYRDILARHVASGKEVTVATIPVQREAAKGFGIMQIDEAEAVIRFEEKPKDDALLDSLRIPESTRAGLKDPVPDDTFLASMGIYVFNARTLAQALAAPDREDFGKHIIPALVREGKVGSYVYQGYWEDIGTIRAFFDANLDLTEVVPKFNFYDQTSPIYSRARFLPASKIHDSRIERAIIADGCIISHAEIIRSCVGVRSRIGHGVRMFNTVMMGSDYFESNESLAANAQLGRPPIGIGANSLIDGAIIDKNARIGRNVTIRAAGKTADVDHDFYHVRDGVVIIPKGAVVPDGAVI
ncbi:MAG: glucose-1-phosphate adenylyltransferase [Candidatus Methylacidiphilales bacterium]